MKVKALTIGTQIIYVPAHANGNSWHYDCERGFITSVASLGAFCRYWSKVTPGELRTKSNSELTPFNRLIIKDTVPQEQVNEQLAKLLKE